METKKLHTKIAGAGIFDLFIVILSIYVLTVGYGDKFPVTTSGRLLGAVLMTIGVGTFGTLTALMASWFVEGKKDEEKGTGENSTNQTIS